MPKSLLLGLQVTQVIRRWYCLQRHTFNLDATLAYSPNFVRIVCQQASSSDAQLSQDFERATIIARISRIAQVLVRLQRIVALLLQDISLQLACQSDTSPFLWQVEE